MRVVRVYVDCYPGCTFLRSFSNSDLVDWVYICPIGSIQPYNRAPR